MSCHVRGSWTLIFIIWVFSHSSVDYTVSYSIKKKGWLIQYIDLQLEPNIYFSEFPRRSITSNLNNGCRWPRRVEEADRGQKSRLIWVWSAVYIIKQYDQQCTVYHQTMALIGFAALLKWDDRHKIFTRRLSPGGTGWKDVFGGTRHSLLQNRAQTPAHHSKSMLINNVMNNWKECFDVVHTKGRKREGGHWTNKRNAFFNFWQWQVRTIVCKVQ